MKSLNLVLILILLKVSSGYCQINVQLLHQLVKESKEEYARQNKAKSKQAVTTANEQVNKSQMAKLKDRYGQIKNRFHTLGVVVDAVQIGIQASPIVSEIITQQSVIYNQAAANPGFIALALEAEKDMAQRSKRLLNYLYGLLISVGDINQMKTSDRKMLFSHVIAELRLIQGISRGLAGTMIYASRELSKDPFSDYINEDKRLVNDILRKVDILKN